MDKQSTNNQGYQEALERIQFCAVNNGKELDLSNLQLKSLPAEIAMLTELQTLFCCDNQLDSLAGIENLTGLQVLSCYKSQLSNLAGIENLRSLQILNCQKNQLTSLKELENLTELRELDCVYNRLSSLAGLEKLTGLQVLNCDNNQLTSLKGLENLNGLQALVCYDNQLSHLTELENLTKLQALYCFNNQLTSLAGLENLTELRELYCHNNQLTSLAGLKNLPSLQLLDCSGNPVQEVPPIFLDNIDGLRAYWRDIERSGAAANTHSKLLLLGNGRVGKTTLCNALVDNQPQRDKPACDSTEGIHLRNWILPDFSGEQGQDWQISIWDFGGQEIYHATHRLFHSQEGVYCVLWAEQTDESQQEVQHPLRYWLDLLADNNTACPVIVVKNQIDRSNQDGLNNGSLHHPRYCNLPHYQISALHNRGTQPLRAEIVEQLRALSALNMQLPKSWLDIRQTLSTLQQPAISRPDFDALCGEDIHSDTLLAYLHNSGTVFYQPDCFKGQIFLDQNWVLTAVYRLFKTDSDSRYARQRIENTDGKVTGKDLQDIYHDYSAKEVALFVDFMQQSQMVCRFSEQTTEFENSVWIVPGLLPTRPAVSAHEMDRADYRYQLIFPWLHRLAIERLLIACHKLAADADWWRNGMKLGLDNNLTCYLSADSNTQILDLGFIGDENAVKAFLPRILNIIEKTRLAAPEKDRFRIAQGDWQETQATYAYMKQNHWFSSEHQQTQGALAYFYLRQSVTPGVESIAPSAPSSSSLQDAPLTLTQNNYFIGNDMTKQTIENSPGAVIAGGDISGTVSNTVTIGSNAQQKDAQLAAIQELLQLLQSADLNSDDCAKYSRYLHNVEEELQTDTPDTSIIAKQIKRFSGITGVLDIFEKGEEICTRINTLLAGSGVTG